jgi:soluble lytic murein transglycosylase-like protein
MKKLLLALVLGCSMSVSASYAKDKPKTYDTTQIQQLVIQIAERHKVPTNLALAIVELESRYNPNVMGKKNEYGLGQILCSTARSMGMKGKCEQLRDPETNLEYTMLYLRYALDQTNNDICKAAFYYGSGKITKSNNTAYCRKMLTHLK